MTGLVMICCYSIYKRRSITIKGLYISTSSLRKWVVVLTSACAEAENLGGQGGLEPPPLFDKGGLSPPKLEVVMEILIAYTGCRMYSE